MGTGPTPSPRPPGRGHRWLLLLPFAWQVALVPLVDDVALRPFSLPFPMAWQMAGILFTSCIVGLVFMIDRRIDARHGVEPMVAAALAATPDDVDAGAGAGATDPGATGADGAVRDASSR